ncbi:MAG TPA: sensor domain-containing diguanylate cyclase [Smithella sp.]|nr:sensor domain-containing diguanylate cyclase [Smithella sp.]
MRSKTKAMPENKRPPAAVKRDAPPPKYSLSGKNQSELKDSSVSKKRAPLPPGGKSAKKYQDILRNLHDGCFELDLAGNFTFFNDSVSRILGYSQEELMGMNFRRYTDEENTKKVLDAYNKIYNAGEPSKTFNWQVTRKDSTKRYIETSVTLQKDSLGEPAGFVGIVNDITERKQIEDALRLSEEKYRTILENIEEGYFEVDLTGKITFINDTICRVTGYTKDELIGMDNRQYTAKEDLKEVYQVFNRVYTTGEPVKEFCWRVVNKDGAKRYMAGSISLIKNSSGKPTGFRGIVRDTTERNQSEELLRESEKRYRLLADNITEHIWILDLTSMNMTYLSPSVEKIYGIPLDEIKNFSLKDILTEESFQKIVDAFFKEMPVALATPPPALHKYTLELGARHKDGHIVPIENTMSFMRDENGRLAYILGETRDITERKKAEALLKKSEEQYRLLADHMKDQVWLMDMKLNITYVSPSVERITGYTADEIKNLPLSKLLTPESLKKALEFTSLSMPKAMKASSKDFEFRTQELEIVLKGGKTVWGECSFSFIRNDQGKVVAILGESRDITDRKLAEDNLRKEEQWFRALIEHSSDIIVVLNPQGNITYINPAIEHYLGYKPEERIGKTGDELVHPDDIDHLANSFILLVSDVNAPAQYWEMRLRHKNGEWRTFESVGSHRVRDGVVDAVIVNYRDITERKKAEVILKESEQRYQELSIVDDLTQLYNSRHFYAQLEKEIERANRYEQPLAILLLDLDDFKVFNDTFGHVEGDYVLSQMGDVIKRCLRETDSAYRYGGEEFTVILPMTTNREGLVTAQRIQAELKNESFGPAGHRVHLTVSTGLSQYRFKEDMKAYVHRVDQLMYIAKKNGKDRICSAL